MHILKRHQESLLLSLIIVTFVALAQLSSLPWHLGPFRNIGESLTYDELSHIPSGYYYLTTGRYDLNPEHPPLVKDVAGLAELTLPIHAPTLTPAQRVEGDIQWTYGAKVLFGGGVNPNTIIHRARLAVTLLNAVLLLVFYFAWRPVVGRRGSLLALALVTLNPFMISNGSLVTTDVASAVLMGAALGYAASLLYALQRDKLYLRPALLFGLTSGLAMVSKFSAVVTIPITAAIIIVYLLLTRRLRSTLKDTVLSLCIGSLIALGVILLFYIPQTRNMEAAGITGTLTAQLAATNSALALKVARHIPTIPVIGKAIGEYVVGVLFVQTRVGNGDSQIFFNNHVYNYKGAGLAYFPVTYIAKMPLALSALSLVVAAGGIWLWLRRRQFVVSPRAVVLLAGFAVAYLAIAATTTLQIGVRYVAADIVCVPALTGIAASGLLRRIHVRWQKWLISGLAVLTFVPLMWSFPYYLSFYNLAFGGIQNGYRLADDSNYDWGQDLGRLDNWAVSHHVKQLYVYGLLNPYLPTASYVKTDMIQIPLATLAPVPKGDYLAVSTTLYEFANAPGTGHGPLLPPVSQSVARPAPSWFIFQSR